MQRPKILMTVIDVAAPGDPKFYAREKFHEYLDEVVRPAQERIDLDIRFYYDQQAWSADLVGTDYWTDDIDPLAHYAMDDDAIGGGYDAMLRQNLDCWVPNKADFIDFVESAYSSPYSIIGALTVGRTNPEYAIVRDFLSSADERGNVILTEAQYDVSLEKSDRYIPCGYPSSDVQLIKRSVIEGQYAQALLPWTRWDKRPSGLAFEEAFILYAKREGHQVAVDTRTRTWHASENGKAYRYKRDGFEEVRIDDLRFSYARATV